MSSYSPTPVHRWNRLACEATFFTKAGPTAAARGIGAVHHAMYDAWTAYSKSPAISTTTGDWLKKNPADCTRENRLMAYSYAAFRVLSDLFWWALPPERRGMFREYMCELGYNPDDSTLDISKPQGIGNLAARMVIESHYGDLSNALGSLAANPFSDCTGYKPVNSPDQVTDMGRWQPLKQANGTAQAFLTAHWGGVRPFALVHGAEFRPKAPKDADCDGFIEQAQDIFDISRNLTDEQKMIAEYWAGMHEDISQKVPANYGYYLVPPAQLCKIARFMARKNENNTEADIKLFFLFGKVLHDAAVAAWDAKRFYDYVRPVTAIRELLKKNLLDVSDDDCDEENQPPKTWNTYIPTPPFAEYVSGHSTFSAGTAEIIKRFYQSDEFGATFTFAPCSSKMEPDQTPRSEVTLCWDTLQQAADQAGMSRRFGGIHFQDGDENGRSLGKKVAGKVWDKAQYFFREC